VTLPLFWASTGDSTCALDNLHLSASRLSLGINVLPEMVASARRYVPRGQLPQTMAVAQLCTPGPVDLAFLGLLLQSLIQVLREARCMASAREAGFAVTEPSSLARLVLFLMDPKPSTS
jgi:hypothetical protein